MSIAQLPILYSFRRCPYAIRARLALKVSTIHVELREIMLKNKPIEMLNCSPKGTVPVLQLLDGMVIDESLDIMQWALSQYDPKNWLSSDTTEANRLIYLNDNEFKKHLDHYKYADRFPKHSMQYYRQQAEEFLQVLEEKLNNNTYLLSNNVTLVDMAIFPFIRQFAYVDKDWFYASKYIKLQNWLKDLLASPLFNDVMEKYPLWCAGQDKQIF